MKMFFKEFLKRGMMFAWIAPIICAIVWYCLGKFGLETLTVNEVALGIVSSTIMGFVAAGISAIYIIEKLPFAFAGLIHLAVLYIDYIGMYLLNGWIPVENIWIFTLIFVAGFLIIWLIIYLITKRKVAKINKNIKQNE